MILILIAILFTTILMVGGAVWIHWGAFIAENLVAIIAGSVTLIGVGLYHLGMFESPSEPASPPDSTTPPKAKLPETEPSHGDSWTKVREDQDGIGVVWELGDDSPFVPAGGAELS